MAKTLHWLPLLVILLVGLTGCKTSHQPLSHDTGYLSSKVQLMVPYKNAAMTIHGTMKLKSGERVQLSFLMPVLRSELARLEVTSDEILLVDRMNKRYVQATRRELRNLLPRKANFAHLEKLLYAASRPNGKRVLTGKDLGIPSKEKGKLALSNFSDKPFSISATQLSKRYRKVELEEMVEMLMQLTHP